MKTKNEAEARASLEAVRDAFEQWRSTRDKRGRVPESLWEAAVSLSAFYSAFRISKTLRLNYRELRHRIGLHSSRNGPSQFVELNVEHIFSSGQCFMELRSPGGFEIKIRTMATFPPRLTELIRCFMDHGR